MRISPTMLSMSYVAVTTIIFGGLVTVKHTRTNRSLGAETSTSRKPGENAPSYQRIAFFLYVCRLFPSVYDSSGRAARGDRRLRLRSGDSQGRIREEGYRQLVTRWDGEIETSH